ncbi:MAG: hypothetical protein ACRESA_04710, partial [Gammaproteobacteria bacterium]
MAAAIQESGVPLPQRRLLFFGAKKSNRNGCQVHEGISVHHGWWFRAMALSIVNNFLEQAV